MDATAPGSSKEKGRGIITELKYNNPILDTIRDVCKSRLNAKNCQPC